MISIRHIVIAEEVLARDTVQLRLVTESSMNTEPEQYYQTVLIAGPHRRVHTFGRYTEAEARAKMAELISQRRQLYG